MSGKGLIRYTSLDAFFEANGFNDPYHEVADEICRMMDKEAARAALFDEYFDHLSRLPRQDRRSP